MGISVHLNRMVSGQLVCGDINWRGEKPHLVEQLSFVMPGL